MQRRDLLQLGALGAGVVFASGLAGCASRYGRASAEDSAASRDFFFVQLSDVHWGFEGPENPEARHSLPLAVQQVNAMDPAPDFVFFTGDLTHTTDDAQERRRRMDEFKAIVARLTVPTVRFIPGEHDAGLDGGQAFRERFGPSHYRFKHRGLNFFALDNVSAPGSTVDAAQLEWLEAELAPLPREEPLVVLTHRPLFDLAPRWDWHTRNGAAVLALLKPFTHVTVFYGHIHQQHHQLTDHIQHHAASSLIFPLPAPGSQDKRTPLPWQPEAPFHGLGLRRIHAGPAMAQAEFEELPLHRTGVRT